MNVSQFHLNLSQPVNKLRFLCIYLETFFHGILLMKLSGKILVKYLVFSDVNFPNFKNHLS